MRKPYSALAVFLLVAALPFAASSAEPQGDMPQAVDKSVQESKEATNKAVMEKLEQQEDKQTTVEYIDDAGITAKVKAKFLAEKGLDSLDIKVVTVDGTVTLMGEVDNADQIALAEKAAMEVDGVRKVANDLTLKK